MVKITVEPNWLELPVPEDDAVAFKTPLPGAPGKEADAIIRNWLPCFTEDLLNVPLAPTRGLFGACIL